jgi:hypothetical protein
VPELGSPVLRTVSRFFKTVLSWNFAPMNASKNWVERSPKLELCKLSRSVIETFYTFRKRASLVGLRSNWPRPWHLFFLEAWKTI